MGIYNNRTKDYAYLPLWRCKLCKLEMECVGKGRTSQVMSATHARARFEKKHKEEKPNCAGEFVYVAGVRKP